MADYRYNLLYLPAKEYLCCLCADILQDPQVTSCCKKYCCKPCIDVENKQCSICGDANFQVTVDESLTGKLNTLILQCTNAVKGCGWSGELGNLDSHLVADCQYALVDCSLSCGMRMKQDEIEEHEKNICTYRQCRCKFCDKMVTVGELIDHYNECKHYPVICRYCKEKTERCLLRTHLQNDCPLYVVNCPFNTAGCSVSLERKQIFQHLETSIQKHLWLMDKYSEYLQVKEDRLKEKEDELAITIEMTTRKEQQLLEKEAELKKKEEALIVNEDKEVKLQRNIEALEILLNEKNSEIVKLRKHVVSLESLNGQNRKATVKCTNSESIKPVHITSSAYKFFMRDFNLYCQPKKKSWTSDPFHTHDNGYKMCFEVDCILHLLRLNLYILPGEFDSQLTWPLSGSITVLVVNQRSNQHHHEYNFIYDESTSFRVADRVMHGNSSEKNVSFSQKLALKDLPYSPTLNRQYLLHNTLKFIISNIDIVM